MTRRSMFVGALLAGLALPAASAQDFPTSSGVHSLRPLSTVSTEPQLQQAVAAAERALTAQLADINSIATTRGSASKDIAAIAPQVEAEQAALDQATATFNARDAKYRTDLAAFQQGQAALEAEIQRQRSEAEALQALIESQRQYSEVVRLNNWANDISRRRDEGTRERERLVAEHEQVEAERAKVARMRSDAEARLKKLRDGTIEKYSGSDTKLATAHAQLRQAADYLQSARELMRSTYGRTLPASPVLERARQRLLAYDARQGKP